MEQVKTIGFIGLGKMGSIMAARIMEAGCPLVVYDRTVNAAQPFVEKGIRLAASYEEVAQLSDIVITMVTNDQAVQEVVYSRDGLLVGIAEGKILVEMSTTSLKLALQLQTDLAEVGARLLNAKVSGSVEAAQNGKLVILAGGDSDVLEEVRPVLEILGSPIIHMGGVETAAAAKIAINILLSLEMQALAETYLLATKSGVPEEAISQAIMSSGMASPVVTSKLGQIRNGDWEPRFKLRLMQKDLKLAVDQADEEKVSIPATAAANEVAKAALAHDLGKLDMAALYLELARLSDVDVEQKAREKAGEPAQAI